MKQKITPLPKIVAKGWDINEQEGRVARSSDVIITENMIIDKINEIIYLLNENKK